MNNASTSLTKLIIFNKNVMRTCFCHKAFVITLEDGARVQSRRISAPQCDSVNAQNRLNILLGRLSADNTKYRVVDWKTSTPEG